MKNVWRGIKQIISTKSKTCKGVPSQIVEGESILKDSNSIAYAFNNYFANIGKINLAASVKYTDVSPMSYMPLKQFHSIFLIQ